MKAVICSIALIVSLANGGSLFAQGRSPVGGPAAGQSHPGLAGAASAKPPADVKTRTVQEPNKPGKQISDHPRLASNLQKLLPQGTNMDAAASGFKNMGQFVAAVHVSNNLNIPFDQLKAKMTTDHMSLGEAVHALKPDLSKDAATSEVKKAEDQAKNDTASKS